MRRQIALARRWHKLPSELIHLDGWAAYLWDQALDWFERWDAGRGQQPAPSQDESFGAYG